MPFQFFAAFLAMVPLPGIAADLTFNDEKAFLSCFPPAQRTLLGGASKITLEGEPLHLEVTAGIGSTDGLKAAQASIYSAQEFSNQADFLSEKRTFVFRGVELKFGPSGATYLGNVGVANAAKGGLQQKSGPSAAIFFRLNRYAGRLELVFKQRGECAVLHSWEVGKSLRFAELKLTLSSSAWSVFAVPVDSAVVEASGAFATPIDIAQWGSSFFVALQAFQSSENPERFATLYVAGIALESHTP